MTSPDRFAAVAERLLPHAHVRSARRLTGGVSADVHAIDVESGDGRSRTVVVREHGAAGWKRAQADVTALEHGLLDVLYRIGLPVPEPLLLDTSAQLLPGPFLVMAFVDGSTDVAETSIDACVDVMATTLAQLHGLPVDDLPALRPRTDPLPELFDYLPDRPEWRNLREHLEACEDSAYVGDPVLLHGDFWPGNLLWRDGRLVGILDWEDAALGDPLADVAGCRVELLWQWGPEAMDRFTAAYAQRRHVDGRRLALWSVFVAVAGSHFMGEWGLEPAREARMQERAHAFIEAAAGVLLSGAGRLPTAADGHPITSDARRTRPES